MEELKWIWTIEMPLPFFFFFEIIFALWNLIILKQTSHLTKYFLPKMKYQIHRILREVALKYLHERILMHTFILDMFIKNYKISNDTLDIAHITLNNRKRNSAPPLPTNNFLRQQEWVFFLVALLSFFFFY